MALPSASDLYSQAMGSISNYGNAEQAALQQSYRNALGTARQSLASSGLAGTTVAPSMYMGYMKQFQQSLNSLSQQIEQSRLGAMSTFGMGGLQLEQQAKQMANQLELGRGNLAVNQGQLALSNQQLELQKREQAAREQQQQFQQNYQQTAYNQSLADRIRVNYTSMLGDQQAQRDQFAAMGLARFNSGWEGYRQW